MKEKVGKKISVILSLILMFIYMFNPTMNVKAESLTVTGVPAQIKIGDTFTISIKVPENVGGTVCVEYSKDLLNVKSCPGSDAGTGLTSYTAFFGSSTQTVTFEATNATTNGATASVTVYMVDAEYSDMDPSVALPSISKVTKTVTIMNEATTDVPTTKSADNSLKSLKLSSGTLSPSFKHDVTKYTATVDYNVTSVVVSAVTSNDKATIESVTGNGTVNLAVGQNTIEVVVKAENGVKATYTIVVTRNPEPVTTNPSESESESELESESESESEVTELEINNVLQWNGEQLQVQEDIPTESIPTDFEKTIIVVNGQQMTGLSYAYGDLKVLYLKNANGAGSLYVYDETQQCIYPFIKLEAENSYVVVLLPNEDEVNVPEGFKSCTLSIEGKGVINAYQFPQETETPVSTEIGFNFGAETFYAAEASASDFYLIYCMNSDGEKGWYIYDSVEGTFQRYLAAAYSEIQAGNDTDLQTKYNELESELESAKMMQYITIGIAILLVVIFVIVIVVLLRKKRPDEEEELIEEEVLLNEEESDNEDDENEIEVEFYEMEEDIDESNDDEDEIEVEFYEIEEDIDESKDEADEVEVEFYEMEESVDVVEESDEDEIEVEFYEIEDSVEKEDSDEEQELKDLETLLAEEIASINEDVTEKKDIVEEKKDVEEIKAVENIDDDDDGLEFIDLD